MSIPCWLVLAKRKLLLHNTIWVVGRSIPTLTPEIDTHVTQCCDDQHLKAEQELVAGKIPRQIFWWGMILAASILQQDKKCFTLWAVNWSTYLRHSAVDSLYSKQNDRMIIVWIVMTLHCTHTKTEIYEKCISINLLSWICAIILIANYLDVLRPHLS